MGRERLSAEPRVEFPIQRQKQVHCNADDGSLRQIFVLHRLKALYVRGGKMDGCGQ